MKHSKKVLLIVDPQIDFISGSLAVNEADKAMDFLVDWIEDNIKYIDEIVVTQDWHPENHSSFEDFGGIWPIHCVENTEGAEIYPKLKTILDKIADSKPISYLRKANKVEKEEYSAFEENLPKALSEADEIFVSGIAGDFCVRHSVADIRRHEFAGKLTYIDDAIPYINPKAKYDE